LNDSKKNFPTKNKKNKEPVDRARAYKKQRLREVEEKEIEQERRQYKIDYQ
jgi:hypothetical protein